MVNKRFWLGILVIALVLGMTIVGCDSGDTSEPYTPPPPQSQPGDSASNPTDRVSDTNLGTMTSSASGWQQLLDSINRVGKYINLDLSACTMTGTEFNPDSTVETGKKYIVSIILPDVATSIETGTYSDATFKNFTNLKSISGANIITIGDYSFRYDVVSANSQRNLQSLDFPKATTIGEGAFSETNLGSINFPQVTTIGKAAFQGCYLKDANFPAVQTISEDAFSRCSSLENISFPASAELGLSSGNYSNPFTNCNKITFNLSGTGSLSVIENGKALVRNGTILLAYPSASGNITMNNITALDGKVFYQCLNLDSINFPQVTSIGSNTFYQCSNLQDVNFPLVTSIGSGAFTSCSRLQSASFPIVTTIDSWAFSSCSNLLSLNIPKVTNIEECAFHSTGSTVLSIIMGTAAPNVENELFRGVTIDKTVKVKILSGATGYSPAASPFTGTSVTVSGTNTTANWANGFRGGGWNGSTFPAYGGTYGINKSISLVIEQQ